MKTKLFALILCLFVLLWAVKKPQDDCKNVVPSPPLPLTYHIMPRLFQGGKLNQLLSALPALKNLGFEQVLLGPVHSQSIYEHNVYGINNHGYWPARHDDVDARLGTMNNLKEFISTAHKLGLKVLLDFPLNHFGYGNTVAGHSDIQLNKIKIQMLKDKDERSAQVRTAAESLYKNLDESENYNAAVNLQKQISQYPLFDLPSLDLNKEVAAHYILESAKKFIDIGVDGFRIDAAKHISFDFLKRFFTETNRMSSRPLTFLLEITVSSRALLWLAESLLVGSDNDRVYFQDFQMQRIIKSYAISPTNRSELIQMIEGRNQCTNLATHFFSMPENQDGGAPIHDSFKRMVVFALTDLLSANHPIIHHGMESDAQNHYNSRPQIEKIEKDSLLLRTLNYFFDKMIKKNINLNHFKILKWGERVDTLLFDDKNRLTINFGDSPINVIENQDQVHILFSYGQYIWQENKLVLQPHSIVFYEL